MDINVKFPSALYSNNIYTWKNSEINLLYPYNTSNNNLNIEFYYSTR